MPRFNLDDYITVAERIQNFWERFPNGAIRTDLIGNYKGEQMTQFVIRAEIYTDRTDQQPTATGFAEETKLDTHKGLPNESSPLENCESSAIGRALRNMGFATEKPSREEMAKVERYQRPTPPETTTPPRDFTAVQAVLTQYAERNIMTKPEVWDLVSITLGRVGKEKPVTLNDLSDDEIQIVISTLGQ